LEKRREEQAFLYHFDDMLSLSSVQEKRMGKMSGRDVRPKGKASDKKRRRAARAGEGDVSTSIVGEKSSQTGTRRRKKKKSCSARRIRSAFERNPLLGREGDKAELHGQGTSFRKGEARTSKKGALLDGWQGHESGTPDRNSVEAQKEKRGPGKREGDRLACRDQYEPWEEVDGKEVQSVGQEGAKKPGGGMVSCPRRGNFCNERKQQTRVV